MDPVLLVVSKVAIVAALGALAVFAGGRVVLWVFALAERKNALSPSKPAASPAAASSPARQEVERAPGEDESVPPIAAAADVLRGGAWIGTLERLAIFASLIAGYPEGLAVALALKGLARYPELKATTSGAAERFIIGTFTSVLVAAAAAGLAHWLIGLF